MKKILKKILNYIGWYDVASDSNPMREFSYKPHNYDEVVKKYTDLGIERNKIFVSYAPSVCLWSLSRKCIIYQDGVQPCELFFDGINSVYTYENNRRVSMLNHEEIKNVEEINNSDGIIISCETYGKPYYRFEFVPTK